MTQLPKFFDKPRIICGPAQAPLIANLEVNQSGAAKVIAGISQAGLTWTIFFAARSEPDRYLLLGFMPEGEARITVQLANERGAVEWAEPLIHQVQDIPAGPREMPPIETHISQPDRMAGKFTFLSVRRRAIGRIPNMTPAQRKFLTNWGMLAAVDNSGRMRWLRKLTHRSAGIEVLSSGNLFIHDTEFCSQEIDMAGDTVRAWYAGRRKHGPKEGAIPVDVQSLHHQPAEMPNGNFLAVSGSSRLIKNWYSSCHDPEKDRKDTRVVADQVIEFTPDGDIVWSWDSFEHLDHYRYGYDAFTAYWHVRGFPGHMDWSHCNGVCYDPSDDSVLLSLRLLDCVIKIDRASGEIRWILGDHDGWRADLAKKLLTPVGEPFRWPWHGHNPRITSEGTIVMFDNGIHMARPGKKRVPIYESFSRGVEYRVNEREMTVEQVWASAVTEDDIKERTWAMGDAHRFVENDSAMVVHSIAMPHGRTDIGIDEEVPEERYVAEFPSYARILEYNRNDIKDILFDMTIRDKDEIIQWEVFSGVRVDSLYPKHMRVRMEDGDHLHRDATRISAPWPAMSWPGRPTDAS